MPIIEQFRGRQATARFIAVIARHFIVSRHQIYMLKECRKTRISCLEADVATDRVRSASSLGSQAGY